MRTCNVPDCNNRHEAQGWCEKHYKRWKKYGDPLGSSGYNSLPPPGFARCRHCGLRPVGDFYEDRSRRGTQTSSECKACFSLRRSSLGSNSETTKKRYRKGNLARKGLTVLQYDEMFRRQGGLCAVCDCPETRRRNGVLQRLAIDHDHSCCPAQRCCLDCIRGLLCESCNQGLGKLRHSTAILAAAIRYLETSADLICDGEPFDAKRKVGQYE